MTKVDLIDVLFDNVGLLRNEAEDLVETILQTMKQTLAGGESIKISGFGTFNVRKKRSRRGRNPKTGEDIEITPRVVVTFHPSNGLKSMVE
ncbi:integration host factor subunit alpha [Candidatus Magnetomonas plexicatena]|uniref:integration host factor subunit alpha n=1 Tax=Candidatus Magnetomonas plexicatena TaxID=2552947 RepID=UPI0040328D5B